jgi:diguanylate cyclase (GGDEF)-like protein
MQNNHPENDVSTKIQLNEQISRLLASERKLYDTQGILDRQLSQMNSLNQFTLATSENNEIPNILIAALSSIKNNFIINCAVGLIYEVNTSKLTANALMLRGKPIENISLELKDFNLNNIDTKQNIIIAIIDNQSSNTNEPIIVFAKQCLAAILNKQIQFENNARILLLSNSFATDKLSTHLLCYCVPPAMLGYREKTLEEKDRAFLNLFCKRIDGIAQTLLYQKKLRKFANELETQVVERTNELKHRLKFEEVITKIAQHLSQTQFNKIQDSFEDSIEMLGLFIKADRISILIFSEDNEFMNITHQWQAPGIPPYINMFQNFPLAKIPNIHKQLMAGEVCQINDISLLPAGWEVDLEVLKKTGLTALVGIPLILQNKCLGFINIAYLQTKYNWQQEYISLFKTFGELLATALERQKAGEQLEWAAKYDILTGLSNRFQFEIVIDNAMVYAQRRSLTMALLSLDLDGFKNINDTFGHDTGDLLLKEVSARIKSCVRNEDFVARMGGDEFVVLVSDLKDSSYAGVIAQKILTSLKQEYHLNNHSIFTNASIGITCFPIDGKDRATLMKNADIAMYQVKDRGGNGVQFLTKELQNKHQKRAQLENALKVAIKNQEFYVVYQPQFDTNKNIIGLEALLRWNNPLSNSNSTQEIIKLAEDCGLIPEIDEWVLKTVFIQRNEWQKINVFKDQKISINLSFKELEIEKLCDRIAKIITETNATPNNFALELTETVLMQDPIYTQQELSCLYQLGFHIVVDDFGTGYSSLHYLKTFPLQALKIDKGFVQNIGVKKEDEIIVSATISLAQQLGFDLIAEGVETKEQLQFLLDHGCKKFQGHYFSRPLKVEEMTRMLEAAG